MTVTVKLRKWSESRPSRILISSVFSGSYPATSFRRESQASSTLSQQSSEEDLDDEGEAEAGHSHPVAARGNASTTSQSDTDFSESSDTERRKSTEQNLYR